MRTGRARARLALLWLVASCGGGGGDAADPCALPADGAGFVLFSDNRTGEFEIRAVKVDGTCDQRVGGTADYDLSPTWSAASGRVAWARIGAAARIVVQDVAGGAQRELDTGAGLSGTPSISPDGSLIAYRRQLAGSVTGDVYVVPAAGGTPLPVAAGQILGNPDPFCSANEEGPSFSVTPAGRFVYFVSDLGSPVCVNTSTQARTAEVWRQAVKADGAPDGAPEQLTAGSGASGRPTVAPDGLSFAYTRVGNGTSRVMVHRIADGTSTAADRWLTTGSTDNFDYEPAFSAAGDAVAVTTCRWDTASSGLCDIALLDAATGALRARLTQGAAMTGEPAFAR